MSDLLWLTEAQMRKIEPYFPLSHGVPRVDDRRIISGIIFVIQGGLRWRDGRRWQRFRRCKASLESHRRGVQQDIRRPRSQGGQA